MHPGPMAITLSATRLQSCRRDSIVSTAARDRPRSALRATRRLSGLQLELLNWEIRTQTNLIRNNLDSPQPAASWTPRNGQVERNIPPPRVSPVCVSLRTWSLRCDRGSTSEGLCRSRLPRHPYQGHPGQQVSLRSSVGLLPSVCVNKRQGPLVWLGPLTHIDVPSRSTPSRRRCCSDEASTEIHRERLLQCSGRCS